MPVHYEKRNHVGWLTLSRPEARNAWGDDFNEEIARRCDEMASDPDIRLAVLTGDEAGGAFSAGANLKNPRTHTQASMAEFIEGLPQRHRSAGQVLTDFKGFGRTGLVHARIRTATGMRTDASTGRSRSRIQRGRGR